MKDLEELDFNKVSGCMLANLLKLNSTKGIRGNFLSIFGWLLLEIVINQHLKHATQTSSKPLWQSCVLRASERRSNNFEMQPPGHATYFCNFLFKDSFVKESSETYLLGSNQISIRETYVLSYVMQFVNKSLKYK